LCAPIDQFYRHLWLCAQSKFALAWGQTLCRLIRLNVQQIVLRSLLCPHARNGKHAIGYRPHRAQVLMRHMSGMLAVLTVAGLVDDKDAILVRPAQRIFRSNSWRRAL
jgi:hypothetical protein